MYAEICSVRETFFYKFKSAPHMGPRTLCPGQSCGVAGTDSAIPERWQASSQRNPEAGLAQMNIVRERTEIAKKLIPVLN